MNLHRPVPSSHKVWFIITAILFIGAWFLPTGKGGVAGYTPVGMLWWSFITHDYISSVSEILGTLGIMTCCFALVAVVVGWLLQFPICIAWNRFHRGRPNTALEPTAAAPSVSDEAGNPKAGCKSASTSSGGGSALDRYHKKCIDNATACQ